MNETNKDLRPKWITVILLVLLISVLHYGTQTTVPLLHDLYRRLYYVPAGLAAIWFGARGGFWVSLTIASLYAPHILMDWHHAQRELANQFMEIGLYFVFSGLLGYFAEREHRFRVECQQAAERLDRSYRQLRTQADQMLEIEEQLRRADRLSAIGQLAAALTHEIRNPLGGIKGTAEILRDEFAPGHPKAEFLDILLRETDRLNRVVEDFLGYARPRAPADENGPADLGEIARETEALVATQAAKSRVGLRQLLPTDLLVRGSAPQLKQVILNLLLNAVQATPPGGSVTIRGEVRPGKVRGPEYREVEGQLVALMVEDEGPGIPEDVLGRVFDPFFTTKSEGTGLGLAISRGIAQAHGGSLTVENRQEGGARFTLALPLIAGEETAS
ncbi:MAG: sensor histidine kinase [Deltaproteobacteria bacterium]|nr:sensor histidine kinase [Deltaproteobacteria bacterium]